ncbi:hypothetical protein [Deinococcus petrolearius]|uniref:Right handed beta helix domain-containing protein n=1 Tax=Deinococcus petrolearius TaxID=1751295 RepID=A0ABW1DN52_9DEIO
MKTLRLASTLRLLLLPALLVGPASAPSGAQGAGLTYSGPIIITKGGTYTGNWQSLDPEKAAVTISTSEPVVIQNANIQSRGALIRSRYAKANLTVRNTRGVGLNPGLPASERARPGYFLHVEEFESVTVENNEMVGTAGMYFRKYLGNPARGQTVRILRNRALNIDGRYSDGPNGFSDSGYARVQFVQFNDVRHLPNARIAWNEVINEPGKSRVEEVINMFVSSGTAQSPIRIYDNYIQGAYPTVPTASNYGGGGIMLGDGASANRQDAAAYIQAYNNQVISTTNQGIAIAAGHDISAYNNRVISSGLLPDGTPLPAQNVGIYVWDLHGDRDRGTFYNNSMRGNVVGWARPLRSPTASNDFWFPDCTYCAGNTAVRAPITRAMEAQEFGRWQEKLRTARVVVGLRR